MKRLFPIALLAILLTASMVFADLKVADDAECPVCPKSSENGTLEVNWNPTPVANTSSRDFELAYHDGTFEGQIGCGGGCAFGVRFTADMPILLTGLTIYTQGDASETGAYISIYEDAASAIAGPPSAPTGPNDGTAVWEMGPIDLSTGTHELTVDNLMISGGDYYVVIWEQTAFLGVATDLQNNYIDRNWVSTGTWSTLSDAVAGDPTLVGNFGITSVYLPQEISGAFMVVSPSNVGFGVMDLADPAETQNVTISNLGDTTFTVTDITVAGDGYSTSLSTPVDVLAGESVVMDVTFGPASTGIVTGTYTITSTADNVQEFVVNASATVYDGFPQYMVWNPSFGASGAAYVSALSTLGYTAIESEDLFMFGSPSEAGYDGVFVVLGMYPDNYSFTEGEPALIALSDYILSGGPVVMEGGDTWAFDAWTSLHDLFGLDGVSDGGDDLTAVDGAGFAFGMNYEYGGISSFVDHIAPLSEEAQLIHTNPADGAGAGVAFLSPNGNTIGLSFEFGGLIDGAYTKADLLAEYIDFINTPYQDFVDPVIHNVSHFDYTLDTVGPYGVYALVSDNTELAGASLFYNLDAGAFTEVAMVDSGMGVYYAEIPGQTVGTTVGYYVSAVDTSENTTMSPADAPTNLYVFSVLSHLPPVYVTAESGIDGNIPLTWMPPGTEAPPQAECADYLVDAMPYNTTGTNTGMGDDFDVTFSDNEDVAYQLNVSTPTTYTMSLCAGTDYDSKLEVFFEDCSTSTGFYNDDACGLQSELTDVYLEVGTYYVVVDGFSTSNGNYTLDIYEQTLATNSISNITSLSQEVEKLNRLDISLADIDFGSASTRYNTVLTPRELRFYGVYRSTTSPVLIDNANLVTQPPLGPTELAYVDYTVTNDVPYFFRILAIYNDGEAASAEVTAMANNHPPIAPFALMGTAEEGSLTANLNWNYDGNDYDFDHFAIYREGYLVGTTTDTFYSDIAEFGGFYHYAVATIDAEDMSSELSNSVTLGLGNLPPMGLVAVGNLDGVVELSWLEPTPNPGEPMFEGFEEGVPIDWTVESHAADPLGEGWVTYAMTGAPEGAQVMRCGDGPSGDFIDEWLITNDVLVGVFNSTLSFYHYGTGLSWDNAPNYLKISVDGGTSWEDLMVWDPAGAGLPSAWTLESVDLSAYLGQNARFAWVYTSTYGEWWHLDAVELSTPTRAHMHAAVLNNPVETITNKYDINTEIRPVVENHNRSGFTVRENPRELLGYEIVRNGVTLTTTDTLSLSYSDYDITNGQEYCYYVIGLYPDGNSTSNESCAMPINYPPAAPENLVANELELSATLDWDDNTDYDFASYNVYRDGVLLANVLTSDYAEVLDTAGIYFYTVTAIDAEDAESLPSNTAILPAGRLPVVSPNAVSGLDGAIDLSWLPPGTVGGMGNYEDFESGVWPPVDWTVVENNAVATWSLYDMTSLVTPAFGEYAGGVWWDTGAQDEWLIMPSTHVGPMDAFSFWAYGYQGSIYGDQYTVEASTDGGVTWTTLLDLSELPIYSDPNNNDFNAWTEPYTIDISAFSGSEVTFAFHAIDGDGFGLWYIWLIDEVRIGMPDAGTLAMNTGFRGTTPEFASRENAPNPYSFTFANVHEAIIRTSEVSSIRETVLGYTIYRSETSPVVLDANNLLSEVGADTLNYFDFPLTNEITYHYVVTADYASESIPSDEFSGTTQNHQPMVPTNFTAVAVENDITLEWDDNTDYDLAGYIIYLDDEVADTVAVSTYSSTLADGVYAVYVVSYDFGGMESDPTNSITLVAGEVPPENLQANGNSDDHIALTWMAPGAGGSLTEFRYDDGVATGQLGFGANPSSILGAAHPVHAIVNAVSWYLTSTEGTHPEVYVHVYGLDAAGVPDVTQVLHISESLGNTDDEWNTYELPMPIEAPNGFYIGVVTPNLFTALGTDDGVGAPYDFIEGTQWGNADYTAGNNWLDVGPAGFPLNFLIRAQGLAMEPLVTNYNVNEFIAKKPEFAALNYSSMAPVEAPFTFVDDAAATSQRDVASYNIYRDGDLLANTAETFYDDMVNEGHGYTYAVTGVFDNGQESLPTEDVTAMANMAPGLATALAANVTGFSAAIEWEDPAFNADGSECIDLEGVEIYLDGNLIADLAPMEWFHQVGGLSNGPHTFSIRGYDEVPNYGNYANIDIWVGPAPTVLQILTDNYPGETSWEIMDGNNNIVMSIAAGDLAGAGELYEWTLDNLDPGLYTFTIYDSFGDGICCAYGEGFYRIVHGEQILAEGGAFATSESTVFEVSSGILMGDFNADGEIHVNDVTRLIELLIYMGAPATAEEEVLMDINGDGANNVLDVVSLIEYMLGGGVLAKNEVGTSTASVSVPAKILFPSSEWQYVPIFVNYEGAIAGLQATIEFDASMVEVGTPILTESNEGITVYTASSEIGLRVLAISLSGDLIQLENGVLFDVPVRVTDENASGSIDFAIYDVVLSAAGGIEIPCEYVVEVIEIGVVKPEFYSLAQNYPNPFNPTTTIDYALPEDNHVELVIYNMLGQMVRSLVTENQTAGFYHVQWNGLNDMGQQLPTGIYIYAIQSAGFSKTMKMAYIK